MGENYNSGHLTYQQWLSSTHSAVKHASGRIVSAERELAKIRKDNDIFLKEYKHQLKTIT